jgi:dipeptidase E
MKKTILLLSSSFVHGTGYLEAHKEQIINVMTGVSRLLFVPFAAGQKDWDSYTERTRNFFQALGIAVTGAYTVDSRYPIHNDFQAIFIGGGNTFRLLRELQHRNLLTQINDAVNNHEVKYMGSSAGTNVACPTIRTTNDMPIVYPENGFNAINLVSFQINPHYMDPDPNSKHMGETREQRINEFHQANTTPVIGLREGSYILLNQAPGAVPELFLGGTPGAKLFQPGKPPLEMVPNTRFSIDLQ